MVTFSTEVNPPGGASYAPPNMAQWLSSFLSNSIGDLPQDYYQGKFNAQKGQENDLALQQQRAFAGGLPTDAQGNPDYRKIVQMLAQKGDINAITQLAPYVKDQGAGTLSPILGGNGAAPAPPNGGAGPYSAPSPAATSAPPASAGLAQSTGLNARAQDITQGGDGEGPTVKQFVSARLPNGNSAQAGDLESRIAMAMDLDPNAPMSAGQQRRALGLFNRYAGTNEAPAGGPATAGAPAVRTSPTFTMPQTAPPNAGSSAERVAQGFGGLAPQNQPLQPQPQVQGGPMPAQPQPQQQAQQPQAPPNRSGLPPTTAAVLQPPQPPQQQAGAGAPQPGQPQGQQQPSQGPIGPQVPLPKGFTDPEQAIMALRREAATNPHPKQAAFADQWAKDIEQSIQPVPVSGTQTLVDPRTGKVVFQGANVSGSSTFSSRDARLNALRSLNGDYSWTAGLGRGAQRGENFKLVTEAIEDIGAERGLNDEQIADTLATANAEFQGRKASERTLGTMEARMGAAAFEAKGAIQLARGVIEKVPRTSFLPWNQLQQGFSKQTLNPDQAELFARTQGIINTYAAVMSRGANVTTDAARGRGEELFNTAVDAPVYNRVLDTITSEINMAINSPEQMREFYRSRFGNKALSQPNVGGQQGAQQQPPGSGSAPAGTVIQYDQNGNRVQ